ncbi:glycine/sarcosine/betaine reductase selenoprotein B family protein [Thermodesulfobacteriota bacterium]
MAPVDWVKNLNKMYQGQGFPPYNWSRHDSSPWVPFEKPLAEACLAFVCSAGISREDQEPFDPWAVNGLGFREVPVDTPYDKLKLNHNYIDHRDAVRDLNIVYPVQLLRKLEKDGFIGRLAPNTITLGMGRLYKRSELLSQTVPPILEKLKEMGADAVLLATT